MPVAFHTGPASGSFSDLTKPVPATSCCSIAQLDRVNAVSSSPDTGRRSSAVITLIRTRADEFRTIIASKHPDSGGTRWCRSIRKVILEVVNHKSTRHAVSILALIMTSRNGSSTL